MKHGKAAAVIALAAALALLACACGKKLTLNEAQEIALQNAGVTADQVKTLSALEKGRSAVISFSAVNGNSYTYEISLSSGEVLAATMELAELDLPGLPEIPGVPEAPVPEAPAEAPKATDAPKTAEVPAPTDAPAAAAAPQDAGQAEISESEALKIALDRIGITEKECDFKRIKTDWERGVLVWEGEIRCNGMEYDFEIDAKTGEILEWEAERADRD